jgi:serine/threonine protein kinase
MIDFLCSHCGAQLRVREERAGKVGRCPRCKNVVVSSTGSGAQESDDVLEAPLPPLDGPEPVFEARSPTSDQNLGFLGPPQRAGELGRLGQYGVLKVLGTGGMGIVLYAKDEGLDREVALKALKPSLAGDEEARQRFKREARTAASLHHDHIVTIYQVDEDRGIPYLAMELLKGESLEDRLNRAGGRLPLDEVLRIGRETAEGLAAAHERGLVHRDIKPDNLWLEEKPRGRIKILDFGLARPVDEDARVTRAGMLMGTPAYMAPEQAEHDIVDPKADLFSLGCVLYRMSTGQLPFRGRSTMAVLLSLASKTPRSPESLNPDLPGPFSDLVMRLLRKSPRERPEAARAVAEELEEMEQALAQGTLDAVEEDLEILDEPVVEEAPPPPRVEKRKPRPRPRGRRPRRGRDGESRWERRAIVMAIRVGIALVLLFLALIGQLIWKHYFGEKKKEETSAVPRVAAVVSSGRMNVHPLDEV